MKQIKLYERPQMRVVEIRQHGMLMQSGIKTKNVIDDWDEGDSTDDEIYM